MAVNPSLVQGPGRAGGTGRIMIAYLNGKLKVFVHTRLSIVDIDDTVEGHILAAEKGRPGERYVINGATLLAEEALEHRQPDRRRRAQPSASSRRPPPAWSPPASRRGFRARGKKPPLCREMMRTMLHGHRYDGSRATRELGLQYTPVEDTFRRTIDWARAEGHLKV